MLVSFKMFMIVVEEMSISRAAARSFVTQQCVSDHIKRIEEEYGVTLFKRRPRLLLTLAGEEMYRSLCEISKLEEDLEKKMKKIKGKLKKKLTIGVNATRINVILPQLIREYNLFFPEVVISFVIKETRELEQLLLKGEIDMLLDLNSHASPQFNVIPLGKDRLHFLISKNMYEKYFTESREKFEEGIDIERLREIPIASNFEGSTVNGILNHYADIKGVELNIMYYTGDYETQLSLCSSDLAGAICPTMILGKVFEYNKREKNIIYIFPIKEQSEELKIELITNKGMEQPEYMKKFVEILQSLMKKGIEKKYMNMVK